MIERFVSRRRARWERLGALLDRTASARQPLSIDELDELARLYRQTAADLAVARRDFPDDQTTLFLNQLLARAHGVVYRDPPAPLSRLRRFFVRELPREYRASWPYLAASAALFFVPLLTVALATILAPETAELIVPPGELELIKTGRTWFDWRLAARPLMASFIMTNNLTVSLYVLAGGTLAGIGTVLLLVYNGVLIGGVSGALIAYGLGAELVGFVSPHAFLELSVIVVAGASGLMLGRAMVWPGLQTRRDALVAAGERSARLLLGTLPFLIIAGLLEGFVSPAAFAWPFKLMIGLGTAILMYGYLLVLARHSLGRGERRDSTG